MDVFTIRCFPDSGLKHPTHPLTGIEDAHRRFVDRLIVTMRAHPRCVGLAAPQVGSTLRIAVMESSNHPTVTTSQGLIVLVNPNITAREGTTVQREGCLSIPDLTANVQRATRVTVRALNQFGDVQEWRLEGFEAIIAQHEIDHLDGTLFLDRVANLTTDVFRRKRYG